MSAPSAEALLGLLVELDRIRALAVELLERSAPRLLPRPACRPAATMHEPRTSCSPAPAER